MRGVICGYKQLIQTKIDKGVPGYTVRAEEEEIAPVWEGWESFLCELIW